MAVPDCQDLDGNAPAARLSTSRLWADGIAVVAVRAANPGHRRPSAQGRG